MEENIAMYELLKDTELYSEIHQDYMNFMQFDAIVALVFCGILILTKLITMFTLYKGYKKNSKSSFYDYGTEFAMPFGILLFFLLIVTCFGLNSITTLNTLESKATVQIVRDINQVNVTK